MEAEKNQIPIQSTKFYCFSTKWAKFVLITSVKMSIVTRPDERYKNINWKIIFGILISIKILISINIYLIDKRERIDLLSHLKD